MRVPGIFHGAVRPAAFSAAIVCLAFASEAAVPESVAPQDVTGEYRAVMDRLVHLERELNDLQRASYRRLAARRTGPQTATDGGYSGGVSQQRLSDLEESLRALTGRVEQLEHQMRQLNERMRRLSASASPSLTPPRTSARPGGDSGAEAGAPAGPGSPRNLAASTPPGSGAGADMPGGPDSQPGAPSGQPAEPASPPPEPEDGEPEDGEPEDREPEDDEPEDGDSEGQSGGSSDMPELSGDEGRDFNTARGLLLKGEFARAGDMFGAIAKAYPESKLAGDSQFWKAESLFVRELYRDAAEAYLRVARDFPKSDRAAESLVKLARSFDKLGERKQACAALNQVSRRYPNAPEPVRQDAERYKEKFSCD